MVTAQSPFSQMDIWCEAAISAYETLLQYIRATQPSSDQVWTQLDGPHRDTLCASLASVGMALHIALPRLSSTAPDAMHHLSKHNNFLFPQYAMTFRSSEPL